MFILFVVLLIASIFLRLWSPEMQNHSHCLFVGTVVWCVHFAPDKVKPVLF